MLLDREKSMHGGLLALHFLGLALGRPPSADLFFWQRYAHINCEHKGPVQVILIPKKAGAQLHEDYMCTMCIRVGPMQRVG